MVIIYLAIIFISGISILYLLQKCKVINCNALTCLEITALSCNIGMFAFFFAYFLFSFTGLRISFIFFIPFIILDLISLFIIFKRKLTYKSIEKASLMELIFLALLLITIISMFIEAITHTVTFPDEFAAWASLPKIFYIEGSMRYTTDYGFVKYPPFLPAIYSGYYFFIGHIDDLNVRAIPTVILFVNILGMYGYVKKKKLSPEFFLFFVVLMLNSYSQIKNYTASLYAEIPFACYYTFGVLYFLDLMFEKADNRTHLFCSILYLNLVCLIKIDGIYMMSFNLVIFVLYLIFNKEYFYQTNKRKSLILSIALSPVIYICYLLFRKYMCPYSPAITTTNKPVIEYTLEMLKNLFTQQFTEVIWTIITILFLIYISIMLYRNYNKKKNISEIIYLFLIIIANIAFLAFCYIARFGGEALIAASYIRYMTRVIFLGIIMILYAKKSAFEKESFVKKSNS